MRCNGWWLSCCYFIYRTRKFYNEIMIGYHIRLLPRYSTKTKTQFTLKNNKYRLSVCIWLKYYKFKSFTFAKVLRHFVRKFSNPITTHDRFSQIFCLAMSTENNDEYVNWLFFVKNKPSHISIYVENDSRALQILQKKKKVNKYFVRPFGKMIQT